MSVRRLLCCFGLIAFLGGLAASAFGATTSWGTAVGVPGLENTVEDEVTQISCVKPGHCTAAGGFRKGDSFVVNEKNGVWGKAIDVKYGAWNSIDSLSCATAGSCAAGGEYFDGNENDHAFLVNKRHGVWGKAMKVPGITGHAGSNSGLSSISCAKPGYCVAAGGVSSSGHGRNFLVEERKDVWHKAFTVPTSAAIRSSAEVDVVSCAGAGYCVAAGGYADKHGVSHPLVVEEKHGVWHKAMEVAGVPGWVSSLSCSGIGSCGAAGTYKDKHGIVQAFVVNETRGVWHKAIEVPGLAALNHGSPGAGVSSISCATAGSCAAIGSYTDGSAVSQPFVVSEKNGKWRKAMPIPGLAALNVGQHAAARSISCGAAGFCAAGGFYSGGGAPFDQQAFVVTETKGVWNSAVEVPGTAALNTADDAGVNAVSCGGARSCVAGGFYVGDFHATQSFVTQP